MHRARAAIRLRSLRAAAAVVAGLFVVGMVPACSSGDEAAARAQASSAGLLSMAAVGMGAIDPSALDVSNAAWVVAVDLAFDGLTDFDQARQVAVPAVAESWSTSDAVHWTFTLSEAASFPDGTRVRAADVVASLDRVGARKDSVAAARLGVIAGMAEVTAGATVTASGLVATDDRTVSITTTGPFADLPALLAAPSFGIVRSASGGDDRLQGTGRYRVGSTAAASGSVRLEPRNTADPAVEFVTEETSGTAVRAVADGRLDWAAGEGSQSFLNGAVVVLGMNVRSAALADPGRRQAIAAAVDRSAIVAGLTSGEALAWPSLIPPMGQAVACDATCASARPAPSGAGGAPGLTYLDVDDTAVLRSIATLVAKGLNSAGLTVEVREHSAADFATLVASGGQELFLMGEAGLAPTPDVYLAPVFGSTGAANLTGLADSNVDSMLAGARSTLDADARRALYSKVDDAVVATGAAVPLVAVSTRVSVSSRVVSTGSGPARAIKIAGLDLNS